ncbi:MAB_1171c family putative transporter [Streptomyces sp. HUAS ZL42]|uniref:MAB_1171c family putative transporter n=1 Tax=Streptomyces sp. HUAS ZL42 TaxID=3231715 RepID=UPI00345E5845
MSLVVSLAGAVLSLSCLALLRGPRPRTAVGNPRTVSTCVAIALGTLALLSSAPPALSAVGALTGVPNSGAPLAHGLLSAYSCSLLVLLVDLRGGSRALVRRRTLCSVAAYGVLIVAIVVLFASAEADTERLSDLDTYYANTPYMREMIVLCLLGHSAAMLVLCAVCVKWDREVTGLLRAGLRLVLLGAVLDVVGFQLAKYTALVARWAGHDLDFLSTTVAPPMASLGVLLCAAGFVLPRVLPAAVAHWRSIDDHRRLGPLWSEIRFASTAPKPPSSLWLLPLARLHWREVSIHDALLALAPYFDDRVRARALDAARDEGRSEHEARVVAEAAMVADAARRAAAREEPLDAPSMYRLYATEVSGPGGLVQLAQALTRSPLVSAVREGTVRATHS